MVNHEKELRAAIVDFANRASHEELSAVCAALEEWRDTNAEDTSAAIFEWTEIIEDLLEGCQPHYLKHCVKCDDLITDPQLIGPERCTKCADPPG